MGLLEKLIKKTADKVASNIIQDQVKEAFGDILPIKDKDEKKEENTSGASAGTVNASNEADNDAQYAVTRKDPYDFTGAKDYLPQVYPEDVKRFEEILAAFPAGTVEKDLKLASLVPQVPRKYKDVDFIVKDGGFPKVAVLLVTRSTCDRAAVTFTMDALKQAGITPLRFIVEFKNKPEYVTDRIKAAL